MLQRSHGRVLAVSELRTLLLLPSEVLRNATAKSAKEKCSSGTAAGAASGNARGILVLSHDGQFAGAKIVGLAFGLLACRSVGARSDTCETARQA